MFEQITTAFTISGIMISSLIGISKIFGRGITYSGSEEIEITEFVDIWGDDDWLYNDNYLD